MSESTHGRGHAAIQRKAEPRRSASGLPVVSDEALTYAFQKLEQLLHEQEQNGDRPARAIRSSEFLGVPVSVLEGRAPRPPLRPGPVAPAP
jgi:hypothetical protein